KSSGQIQRQEKIEAPSQAAGAISQDYEAQNSTAAEFTSVLQTQLTTEFDISIAYDIPSDGKAHLIAIQDYELPAMYRYYAVPKLDPDAFLTADISDWEDL